MTFKEWERRLKRNLNTLSNEEINKILDYYREMYGDKADAGLSEDKIVDLFGSPEECAKKLLIEEGRELSATPVKKERKTTYNSPAQIVGIVFSTLFLFLYFFVVLFSLIVSFASIGISGVACAVAGVLYAIGSPIFFSLFGTTAWGIFANVSVGITTTGIGLLLIVLGYYATKHTTIFTVWLFKKIYFRGAKK